jgi:hypothetical protein
MHYTRWLRHSDPQVVQPSGTGAVLNAFWKGDDVGYTGMHDRLRSWFGSASDRLCAVCGGSAAQWSYDHADPDEKASPYGPYSVDTDHYRALCVPCHKRFDLAIIGSSTSDETDDQVSA